MSDRLQGKWLTQRRFVFLPCFSRSLVWWLGFIVLFRPVLFSLAVASYYNYSGEGLLGLLKLFGPGPVEGDKWWWRRLNSRSRMPLRLY